MPTIENLQDIINFFKLKAINDIIHRQIGIPGGLWYSNIRIDILRAAGFYYYTVREKSGVIIAKVWTSKGIIRMQIWPIIKECDNIWYDLLSSYILCAISDMVNCRLRQRLPNDINNNCKLQSILDEKQ